MGLSCSCDFDGDGWWYSYSSKLDFKPFQGKYRKRCCSCKQLIDIGNLCLEFDRYRSPLSDIEERMCGDEVPLADWYLCEACGEIFLNLDAIGYCYYLGDDIRENMVEYWDLTGFYPDRTERLCRTGG
uniref:Uncharacterized protein n=1 Tax=viral metagenome TaxID=1070528 RepID=A0A6H2A376_9ZZZZ